MTKNLVTTWKYTTDPNTFLTRKAECPKSSSLSVDIRKKIKWTNDAERCFWTFEKGVQNTTNLIIGNFKLMMQEIHGLKSEINGLRKSLEFTRNNWDEKIFSVEKKFEKLNSDIQEIYEHQIDPKYFQYKLAELEDTDLVKIIWGLMG